MRSWLQLPCSVRATLFISPSEPFRRTGTICRPADVIEGDISLANKGTGTLEEREARTMASATALRRDFAPIVRVRAVQQVGPITLEVITHDKWTSVPEERVGISGVLRAFCGKAVPVFVADDI